MGKPARKRSLSDTQARAVGRNIRVSPRKLNLVAQAIRGQSAEAALATLTFSQKRIAGVVKKVLQSAIANAENNHQLDPAKLRIKGAFAQTAGSLKRFVPKARGSAGPILKRSCHIKIVLTDE